MTLGESSNFSEIDILTVNVYPRLMERYTFIATCTVVVDRKTSSTTWASTAFTVPKATCRSASFTVGLFIGKLLFVEPANKWGSIVT